MTARYIGADSEMVEWATDDDGSAAHEPVMGEVLDDHRNRLAAQIGLLMCRVDQLEREKEALRESRDHWLDVAAKVVGTLDGLRAVQPKPPDFPLNALKHSL